MIALASDPIVKAVEGPEDLVYTIPRMRRLMAFAEGDILRAFLRMIREAGAEVPSSEVEEMLSQGRVDEALATYLTEQTVSRLSSKVNTQFLRAGEDMADHLTRGGIGVVVDFDAVNVRAVDQMRRMRLHLVRQFTEESRAAVREAVTDGARRGVSPRVMAREFRGAVGLTDRQVRAVNNYRAMLERNSTEALTRQLRDRRFDGTVRRASRSKIPLTSVQIDRMVGRYRERYVAHRAETIARTEALRAVHAGQAELFQQAYDAGTLSPEEVVRTWITARDERVRGSHAYLSGQRRTDGEPFLSGNGNLLRWPGDEMAPASETVKCRCTASVRVRRRRRVAG